MGIPQPWCRQIVAAPKIDVGFVMSLEQPQSGSDKPPPALETTGPAPPAAADSRPLPTVPGYEISEWVGGGGQGEVYRARHLGLDRVVAVKILRDADRSGRDNWDRFRREARVIARLDHPGIVRVYGYDESENRLVLCMEYLAGGSLKDRIGRTGRFALDDAVELLLTLTAAIAHAHAKGIVHRDLKPANILFTTDGLPKIVDFGLAKVLDDSTTRKTHTGAILGSPSYMAPEQAAGQINRIGPATDVYGLGAILYELLTGRPPFSGQTLLDTLDRVRFQPAVPPTLWRSDIPPRLEQICLRCLEKSPEGRYHTAKELSRALLAFRNRGGVELPEAEPSQPAIAGTLAAAVQAPVASSVGFSMQRGAYRLDRRIKAGAFGEVWSALAPGGIRAAIKVYYRPISEDAPELKALHLIKNLNHPYLLKIHAWWVEEARLHVAMELADGSLRGRLRKGRSKGSTALPLAALLTYIREVAEALDYMHGRDLLHRNITPENILLVQGHAKIGDFSLVCDVASPGDATAGAVAYMAPECFRAEVTPRSDQYSLALTYAELRRGRHPFPTRTTLRETMRDALENIPDLGTLDRAEKAVLRKALAKEALERYGNCREFAEALTRAVN
jgi:serine/threonine protein kinase